LNCDKDRGEQPDQHDQHLLKVGPGHGPYPAQNRVQDDDATHQNCRELIVPAQDHSQYNGGSIQHHSASQAALNQKNQAHQRTCLGVKSLLEVLIGGKHIRVTEPRRKKRAHENHCDGQSKVKLNEPHAIGIGLACGRNESDRAGLRCHNGQRHGVPGQ